MEGRVTSNMTPPVDAQPKTEPLITTPQKNEQFVLLVFFRPFCTMTVAATPLSLPEFVQYVFFHATL